MTPNLLNYVQFSSWCTAEPFFLKRICKAVYLYSDKKNEKIRIQLIISGCHKQVKKNHLISILKKSSLVTYYIGAILIYICK